MPINWNISTNCLWASGTELESLRVRVWFGGTTPRDRTSLRSCDIDGSKERVRCFHKRSVDVETAAARSACRSEDPSPERWNASIRHVQIWKTEDSELKPIPRNLCSSVLFAAKMFDCKRAYFQLLDTSISSITHPIYRAKGFGVFGLLGVLSLDIVMRYVCP